MQEVTIEKLYRLMVDKRASDICMATTSPIHIKINGVMVPINQEIMTADRILSILAQGLTENQMHEFHQKQELNTSRTVQGLGTFRFSLMIQRAEPSVVIRYIPMDIPKFHALGLPSVMSDIVMDKFGLILLVGATGSGKSTSIASMLDMRNEQRSGHILTIEDPIEYVFRNKKSIVNQREVGVDTESYAVSLKNALRQAPDCIMIGEIRDRETMTAAIQYAQSGHLVISTLHANNSYHALNRIVNFYPVENRPALLGDLSACVKAVISQRLMRSKTGARVPAVEVLLNTQHTKQLIEEGRINDIREAIEQSLSPGSQTFEQALYRLIRDEVVSEEEALIYADSPTNLLWLLHNRAFEEDRLAAQAQKEEQQDADKIVPGLGREAAVYQEFSLEV